MWNAGCGVRNTNLKEKTRQFAIDILKLVGGLPKNRTADVLCKQLLRAGTSVGANYRSACRAKSRADFISKMGIVEEEADESLYWLELVLVAGLVNENQVQHLMNEIKEIIAMVVASIKTARRNKE